jgi:hypothetical protein
MATAVKNNYFGIITDHAIEVTQEKKIEYIINGYINLVKDGHPQEDVVMMYYDTLDELSLLDIRVLKLYSLTLTDSEDNIYKVHKDYEIEDSEVNLVREKLSRLGLIEGRREGEYDKVFENVKNVIDFLEKAQKGSKNNKLKVKKLTPFKSNKLTSYGNKFIRFFSQSKEPGTL